MPQANRCRVAGNPWPGGTVAGQYGPRTTADCPPHAQRGLGSKRRGQKSVESVTAHACKRIL
jgi:hypothetical protein